MFVEFIICFIPMFIFFMGITQLAFSYAAKIVVQYAADRAVRAAIVTEPLPKRECEGGDPGDLGRDFGPGANSVPDPFNQQAESTNAPASSSPLLNRARAAAYVPLASLGPPLFAYPAVVGILQTISGFAGRFASRFAAGYFVYNRSHASVSFRNAQGAVYTPDHFAQDEPVTVRVAYLQYCMIPIASRIMCNPLSDIAGISREAGAFNRLTEVPSLEQVILTQGQNLTAKVDEAEDLGARVAHKLEYAKNVYSELLNSESPEMLLAWLSPTLRFQMIRAEATLPAQFASYVDLCQTPN